MHGILQKLEGGDRRSIGRVDEVVAEVLAEPELFDVVFEGMLHESPLIRMRCADAVEKITAVHPEYLKPYKKRLIQQVAKVDLQEVRWHAALMFSRLELEPEERYEVVGILNEYLGDESKIVRTFAMQALADLAEQDERLQPVVVRQFEELIQTGSPAMKSRGRKLLIQLKEKRSSTSTSTACEA